MNTKTTPIVQQLVGKRIPHDQTLVAEADVPETLAAPSTMPRHCERLPGNAACRAASLYLQGKCGPSCQCSGCPVGRERGPRMALWSATLVVCVSCVCALFVFGRGERGERERERESLLCSRNSRCIW